MHGCICTLNINTGLVQFFDIPTMTYTTQDGKRRNVINEDKLLNLIRSLAGPHVAFVIIEYQQAFFRGSRTSTFKIGDCYGLLRGMFMSAFLNITTVKPRDWKKSFGLIRTDDMPASAFKELSRQKALKLFPNAYESLKLRLHHNRAESALIAEWGRRYHAQRFIHGYKYTPFRPMTESISSVFGGETHQSTTS